VSEDKAIILVELRGLKTEEERLKSLHRISVSSKVPQEKYKNLVAFKNA
jgi:hypothetical protein